jgi:D-alanine-D-alanine ligase
VKIAVLMGGTSPERDVSLATGRAISRALRSSGHDVVAIDAAGGRLIPEENGHSTAGIGRQPPASGELSKLSDRELACRLEELPELKDTAAIFVALHGGSGEDGRVQAVLDLRGIPYTGSGPLGSALAMDKLASKELFLSGGVPTPPWLVGPVEVSEVEDELGGFPVVVKPSKEGSTVGVSVVRDRSELEAALEVASGFTGPPIVERFIPGQELAVGVLGDEALPIVEIRPSHEIYDYECKYTKGMSEYEVPAPLSEECTEEVQELAVRAHRVLRLSAYSRVDFRLDRKGRPWCLEANSLPGMTATSLIPKAAAAAGITFEELCEWIVRLALEA